MPIPCPHFKITIVKRSQGHSAVAGAAYQSSERLFSEYDQKTKFYNKKKELVHAEIMLPSHAPPGFADRATLWNAVEAVENQWNSQLARRIVLAFPVEVPKEQYLSMIKEFCQEQFVSKGMIVDFAIHDKGDGNPHAHILLTLRAMDEHGKWLPKARKVYDLDENGERIQLPSGNWKCHKENTVDWNDQKYAEIWRHSWETITNRYLEAAGRPERVDLRSFERQGIQQIPTVHLGPAAHQMEKRGIETFLGNLNRDIRAANSLMQSIRSAIRGLQRWIADLTEKKQILLDALEKAKEPTLSDLLVDYFNLRNEQRNDWSGKAKLKCTVRDFEEVKQAVDYLKAHSLNTIEDLDTAISNLNQTTAPLRRQLKQNENRMRAIAQIKDAAAVHAKLKPVHDTFIKKNFKLTKDAYAAQHKDELDAFNKAVRTLMKLNGSTAVDFSALDAEFSALQSSSAELRTQLEILQPDIDNSEKNREYRCRSYEYQIQHGFMLTADNYGTGYSGTATRGMGAEAIRKKMESINPDKFKIRKFGVSDVIGLTEAGKTFFFYVDKDRLVRFNGFFPKPQSGTYLILDEGGYQVAGQKGTWMVSDEVEVDGQRFVQMRSEQTKNPPPSIILHESGAFVTQTALGFDGEATRKMSAFLQGPKPELLHHQKFFENGTAERAKESGTEQNYNMIDGCVNNAPKKPRRIGGRWSVLDRLHIKQAERRQKDNAPQQEQERSRKN